MSGLGDGTRVVHAGLPRPSRATPFLPGPALAAPFHLERRDRQLGLALHALRQPDLGALRGGAGRARGGRGRDLLLRDGRGDGAAADLPRAGDGAGDGPRRLSGRAHARHRATWPSAASRFGSRRRADSRARVQGAQRCWLESPSNPRLEVDDLAALADAAHAAGASASSTTRRPDRSTRARSTSAPTTR